MSRQKLAKQCAWIWIAAAGLLLLQGCVSLVARPTLPSYSALPMIEQASPNVGERRPSFVILHHTTNNTVEEALLTLTHPLREVSAHYLIARDGRVFYLVDELKRAWHAGDGYWGGHRDLNSASIGIELDNNGREPYAKAQIDALLGLLDDVVQRWNIPRSNILGHGDIAPGRKVDPSARFPWRHLASAGFGLWCNTELLPPPPADAIEDGLLLAALGYDVSRLPAARAAFRRHWLATLVVDADQLQPLSAEQRSLVQCLLAQRQARE